MMSLMMLVVSQPTRFDYPLVTPVMKYFSSAKSRGYTRRQVIEHITMTYMEFQQQHNKQSVRMNHSHNKIMLGKDGIYDLIITALIQSPVDKHTQPNHQVHQLHVQSLKELQFIASQQIRQQSLVQQQSPQSSEYVMKWTPSLFLNNNNFPIIIKQLLHKLGDVLIDFSYQ